MIKKLAARSLVALAAIGFTQASMMVPARAQPPGYGSCTNYAVWVCRYHGDEIGYGNDITRCVYFAKLNCDAGYYYEDIIYAGLIAPLLRNRASA